MPQELLRGMPALAKRKKRPLAGKRNWAENLQRAVEKTKQLELDLRDSIGKINAAQNPMWEYALYKRRVARGESAPMYPAEERALLVNLVGRKLKSQATPHEELNGMPLPEIERKAFKLWGITPETKKETRKKVQDDGQNLL